MMMTWLLTVLLVLFGWYELHRLGVSFAGWCPFCRAKSWLARKLLQKSRQWMEQGREAVSIEDRRSFDQFFERVVESAEQKLP